MKNERSKTSVMHPYVDYIKHRLDALLQFIDLEYNGQVIPVTGFRLKNLKRWSIDESGGLLNNLDPISGYCNAKCEFCYEIGNPIPYERAMLSLEESRTRIKYYDPKTGIGLIKPTTRLYLEPLTNPHLIEILRSIREHSPDEVFSLTTNGSLLSPQLIREMAKLNPLALVISVNSSDPRSRIELMRDPRAAETLKALPLLREYQIPFVGSAVAWHTLPLDELAATVQFIDQFQPRAIRVTLPGYSRYFSTSPLFDRSVVWQQVTQMLDDLRPELQAPLVIMPNLYCNLPLVPRIDGVILNSPAHLVGLRPGDLMVQLDDEPILTKRQAKALLMHPADRKQARRLEVKRDGVSFTVELQDVDDISLDLYPYKPRGFTAPSYSHDDTVGLSYGVFLNHDLELSALRRLMTIVAEYKARHVLVLTSEIIGPLMETIIQAIPEFREFFSLIQLDLCVPPHEFWGGNIVLGDLYMVSDYLAAARDYIANAGSPPDLITIPSSFASEFGFDLRGVSYTEIERRLNIPVELIPCERIMI